tara:strand:- start:505 stop:1155 length:651 start_codon:yes stop_codon:yes gene_type:complete
MLFIINLTAVSYLIYQIHYKVLGKYRDNIRWYTNHTLINGLMVLTTTKDLFSLLDCEKSCYSLKPLGGPLYSWYGYQNIELIMLSNMLLLHGYHIFFFKNLRGIDYLHHILMMTVLIMAYMMNVGVYMSYFLFFICGLPGMIDYGLLAIDYDRREEKRINTYLNNYLRAPGIMFGMGMLWKDSFHISPFYVFISFLAMFWNAQYFNYEIIKSYYIR